jgi:hypothetical protein
LQQVRPGDVQVGNYSIHPRENGGGLGVTWVPGFGSWIPFLPRTLQARLVAQDIVETLLDVAWQPAVRAVGPRPEIDFKVRTESQPGAVIVTYLPDPAEPSRRVKLRPIPIDRLR